MAWLVLVVATRTIPVGTGYAVWVGIGAVGTFVFAVVVRDEATSASQVMATVAFVASIMAVKLTASH